MQNNSILFHTFSHRFKNNNGNDRAERGLQQTGEKIEGLFHIFRSASGKLGTIQFGQNIKRTHSCQREKIWVFFARRFFTKGHDVRSEVSSVFNFRVQCRRSQTKFLDFCFQRLQLRSNHPSICGNLHSCVFLCAGRMEKGYFFGFART